MKIGIMTWHYGANHGAILQAYALKKVIEDMGHETVLLPFEEIWSIMFKGNLKG